jgi:hypothetical protein
VKGEDNVHHRKPGCKEIKIIKQDNVDIIVRPGYPYQHVAHQCNAARVAYVEQHPGKDYHDHQVLEHQVEKAR